MLNVSFRFEKLQSKVHSDVITVKTKCLLLSKLSLSAFVESRNGEDRKDTMLCNDRFSTGGGATVLKMSFVT